MRLRRNRPTSIRGLRAPMREPGILADAELTLGRAA